MPIDTFEVVSKCTTNSTSFASLEFAHGFCLELEPTYIDAKEVDAILVSPFKTIASWPKIKFVSDRVKFIFLFM